MTEAIPILYDLFSVTENKFYKDITDIATMISGYDRASITLVDSTNEWFKTKLEDGSTFENPRKNSFAYYAIQHGSVEILDATLDERFKTNPFVTGDSESGMKLRSYYGVAIYLNDKVSVGALSIGATVVKPLSKKQIDAINALARQVGQMFTMRESLININNRVKLEMISERVDYNIENLTSINDDLKNLIKEY